MNPAPTLLDDWVTNTAFWWFILIAATTGVVWLTASFVKVWRTQDAKLSPPPHVVNWCDRNGHTYRPTVRAWRCTHCGHRPPETVYDQDVDTVEDYANGEAV